MAKAQTCYYPNSTASIDTPCHSDAAASACCNDGDTCLSNGLCLAQHGPEVISRGSCTDQSWESPSCPQHCADVEIGAGAPIFFVGVIQGQWLSCCSTWKDNTCDIATKGSNAPFFLEAGRVIFNRTSGSTSTNITELATVTLTTTFTSTVTAAALTSPSSSPSVSSTSLSCSNKEAAVGAGLGVSLGLALIFALGLLWRQRKHKQGLSADAQKQECRYNEMMPRVMTVSGAQHQQTQQLPAWIPDELDGRPRSFPPEMADRPRGA